MTENLEHLLNVVEENSIAISREEATALFYRARAGDKEAGDRLFWSVAKLAVQQANIRATTREQLYEMISDAFEGVTDCIYSAPYNPEKAKFSTYVVFYVRRRLFEHAMKQSIVHVPQAPFWRLLKASALPGLREVRPSDRFGNDDSYERVDHEDDMELIYSALEFLDRRTRQVVLDTCMNGKTLRELGERYGISKERVRQIKNAGIDKIRRRVIRKRPHARVS